MSETSYVLPGQKVADSTASYIPGHGIYSKNSQLFASLPGYLAVGADGTLSVRDPKSRLSAQVVPRIDEVIIGRVVKLTSRYAGVDILAVEDQALLMDSLKATVRTQDIVHVEEREIPPLHHAFRPGDLIRAKIIGMGDPSAGFLLSTGLSEELGVIWAKSMAAGAPLIPVSWNEMACSQTGAREKRKCAKPKE